MTTAGSRIGHALANVLGVKLEHDIPREDNYGIGFDAYIERDPTPSEWLQETLPNRSRILDYFHNLFPFIQWIGRYNTKYLFGDVVAGITVGAVVVPESIAYARLAGLNPEFGLYTAFAGSLTYWVFATSKDISIGPIAIMSAITGNIVSIAVQNNPEIPAHVFASALALVAGAIVSGLGLLRLGFLVDLLPLPSIYAFMTGAAFVVGAGQLPSLLGIPHHPSRNHEPYINTGDPAYLIFIDTLKSLGQVRLDAALGLTALAMLYGIRYVTTQAAKRFPSQRKAFFFMNTLRITFVILLYTLVSYLANRNRTEDPMFKILGTIPRGFQHLGVPVINSSIIKTFASKLPVAVIVILLEHIASAKAFGRINSYTIQPSQELLASGFANILGSFFGGFVVTGSFARTAISSKAGVRTPLGGIVVSMIVLLSIYALTIIFFYFPPSVLSAIIIHAIFDLIILPEEAYRIFRISPFDFVIFIAGVLLAVFMDIEIAIYVTIGISAAVLIFRQMKGPGRLLGKVKIRSMVDSMGVLSRVQTLSNSSLSTSIREELDDDTLDKLSERNLFLPLDHQDGTNPEINIETPIPGIFVYRFSENFTYMNASHNTDQIHQSVYLHTQRSDPNTYKRPGDRPWNAPVSKSTDPYETSKPHLKSIILDFSAVNNVDSTSICCLHDLRNQLDQYASPDRVSWHFANINNRWTKKALTAVGFGYDRNKGFGAEEEAYRERGLRPIFNITNVGEDELLGRETHVDVHEKEAIMRERSVSASIENGVEGAVSDAAMTVVVKTDPVPGERSGANLKAEGGIRRRGVMVSGSERPYFHVDLTSALQSVMAELRHKKTEVRRDTGVLP